MSDKEFARILKIYSEMASGLDADGNDIQEYDDNGNQVNKYKNEPSSMQDVINAMQTAIIALEDVMEEDYNAGKQLKQIHEIRTMRNRLAEIRNEYDE